jgi:hypothetical protein
MIGLGIVSKGQERWTVALNSKLLLTATSEDTVKNRIVVNDLKKGSLLVTYVPGKVENERKRRIMIFDAADQELYSKEAHNISVPVASIKKWRYNTPFIRVYTIPVLGVEGANVRLRRVHLATIQLQ